MFISKISIIERSHSRNCEDSFVKTVFSTAAETSENRRERSVISYVFGHLPNVPAWPVSHNSLLLYSSENLKKLQKRALRIICPTLSYREVGIDTLFYRREFITKNLFEDVDDNTEHKLHELLPNKNKSIPSLWKRIILMFQHRFCDSFA